MDFRVVAAPAEASAESWAETAADALLVVVVSEGGSSAIAAESASSPTVGALGALGALGDSLRQAVDDGDLEMKPGRTAYLAHPPGVRAKRLVFAVAKDGSAKSFKSALGAGLAVVKPLGVSRLAVVLAGATPEAAHAEALVAAVGDAVYLYRHTKPSAPPAPKLAAVSWLVGRDALAAAREGLRVGMAIGAGVALAREWANRPANHCTPTMLGDEAARLGKEFGFKVDVLGPKEVEKLGMGSFLAVARGSEQPLRFIAMHYRGTGKVGSSGKGHKNGKASAPVVLVGKGITFDTGGISLKGGAEMDEMKFDMGGAASVLGAMRAIAELQPAVDVVGLIASTENMPDGRAVKPGDVVTSMSGQTIEILNTDAEGRLVLCDALTYAERFEPQAVVDIATLTGACVVALGHHHSGLFTADDALAADLVAASRTALDPCWRMPLDEEYDEGLKSNFADMGNIGGRAGGAITAAMFLKRFTAKYPWAHLDIAGTAWKSGAAKGGTGRPVGLLTHFALSRAASAAPAQKPPRRSKAVQPAA